MSNGLDARSLSIFEQMNIDIDAWSSLLFPSCHDRRQHDEKLRGTKEQYEHKTNKTNKRTATTTSTRLIDTPTDPENNISTSCFQQIESKTSASSAQ